MEDLVHKWVFEAMYLGLGQNIIQYVGTRQTVEDSELLMCFNSFSTGT